MGRRVTAVHSTTFFFFVVFCFQGAACGFSELEKRANVSFILKYNDGEKSSCTIFCDLSDAA